MFNPIHTLYLGRGSVIPIFLTHPCVLTHPIHFCIILHSDQVDQLIAAEVALNVVILSKSCPFRWMTATASGLTSTCFRLHVLKYTSGLLFFTDTEALYWEIRFWNLSSFQWLLLETNESLDFVIYTFVCLLMLHKIYMLYIGEIQESDTTRMTKRYVSWFQKQVKYIP